ncbi:toll/interleukin-1 receptor domain-containing protein [Bradyrhizobium sp. URHD0069]|uniref:toll/interleukin-1 receptor domain-containing protein n=1 Tax=Bradyrhizobium sp. URHD0069 TaxID=1380355 RepID=UPI000497D6D6|nr:toll/interleukin-1 receptor domain-containing protein [Bradyrhizobium sp. URHD0069]
MPYSTAESINIFLSYAHEDQAIADTIASTLRKAFYDTFDITMMSEFPVGLNWRRLIDDSIESTDIMIAIVTGRLKPGHSFTGYEIGSFSTSMRFKPNMGIAPKLARRMIPFAVLDKTPAAINDFEGIDIEPKALHAVWFDAGNAPREIEKLSLDGSDTATEGVIKFLSDIQDIISEALPKKEAKLSHSRERIDFFNSLALSLCQKLFSDISNRERSVVIPKSKLIIRVQPGIRLKRDALTTVSVQTQGSCRDSFGIDQDDQVYDWESFLKFASSEDVAYAWNEAFRSLLASLNTTDFVENNTILSYDRKRTFRLFVARLITLYSGIREYHVYVIPLLKPKDYGDPSTTLLLKALQVSLGYRFMFLEGSSDFSPDIIRATKLTDLQSRVSAMRNSLNMLLQIADDGGLNDPEAVVAILGVEGIEEVFEMWDKEKKSLYMAAGKILVEPVDAGVKAAFVAQLSSFCDHTRDLNQRYTSRVMDALQQRIGEDRQMHGSISP